MKLCAATDEMTKAGMKELDIDTMSASLQQSIHAASDMLGIDLISLRSRSTLIQ